jgi:hypothetical protein
MRPSYPHLDWIEAPPCGGSIWMTHDGRPCWLPTSSGRIAIYLAVRGATRPAP